MTKCGIKLLASKKPDRKIKHYDTTKRLIVESAESLLKLMGLEQIDLFLLHRPDPLMDPDEVAEAFHLLNEKRKIFHFFRCDSLSYYSLVAQCLGLLINWKYLYYNEICCWMVL